MVTFAVIIFIIGYVAIALEHSIHLNKAASALLTGAICWTLYMLNSSNAHEVTEELTYHLGDVSSILVFLFGAMSMVEIIDAHNGFSLITNLIRTRSKVTLLWIISALTFFLSALLDNLTTAIVMTSLCNQLLNEKEDRLWFASLIVIAANAGGAWSPIGDVTTTMLWIGNQVTAGNIIVKLILPSLAVYIIPTLFLSYKFKNQTIEIAPPPINLATRKDSKIVLISGILLFIFVPIFKTISHLPPFVGMLLALGIMWIIVAILHAGKSEAEKKNFSVVSALQKTDLSGILFFLGILLAVASLEAFGLLKQLSVSLNSIFHNDYLVGTFLGILSAVIDNVPLVAAAQGMYDLASYPTNHPFWEFLALTTGTGGSMLIIGSAAGVAVMGIEKIDFVWYLKKISWLALTGYAGGILLFLLQQS